MNSNRHTRHDRIRAKVKGTAERPRASVFRSLARMGVQLVDDEQGYTLLSVWGDKKAKHSKTEEARVVGEKAAKLALARKIKKIVFDRSGYRYHGRVKALAEGLRAGGLKF